MAANQLKKVKSIGLPFCLKHHLLIEKCGPFGQRSNEQYFTSVLSHMWPVHKIQKEGVNKERLPSINCQLILPSRLMCCGYKKRRSTLLLDLLHLMLSDITINSICIFTENSPWTGKKKKKCISTLVTGKFSFAWTVKFHLSPTAVFPLTILVFKPYLHNPFFLLKHQWSFNLSVK